MQTQKADSIFLANSKKPVLECVNFKIWNKNTNLYKNVTNFFYLFIFWPEQNTSFFAHFCHVIFMSSPQDFEQKYRNRFNRKITREINLHKLIEDGEQKQHFDFDFLLLLFPWKSFFFMIYFYLKILNKFHQTHRSICLYLECARKVYIQKISKI